MNVAIIGKGNVATVLGKRIKLAGHTITNIYGRGELDTMDHAADLYVVAITDTALYDLPLQLGDKVIVHTAGSVSKDVLKPISSNYGVLYPLQSLRKELDTLTDIPLLIDANNNATRQLLKTFAKTISGQVSEADDQQRMKLHVAAVIASNFTNHLYALAEDYCKKEKLDFSLLYPLINETAQRIKFFSPAQMQTGPAVRKDDVTIANHLAFLQAYPALHQLYQQLTDSIKEMSPKNF